MRNLAALTTFFVTFLFVVYLGVFAGLKVNSLISGKKLVSVLSTPQASATVQPTSNPKPSVIMTQVSPTKAPVRLADVATPAPVVDTPAPIVAETPAPIQSGSAPAPAPSVPPPTPPPAPIQSGPADRCIITISGGSYDVTDYRNIHSGGDVFSCGTDMTASFLNRHPASFLQKMSQYRV